MMENSNYRMDPRTTEIVLLNTLKYLHTKDLLRASQVSAQWHSITSRNIYWRTIMLKDCSIVDLSGLVKTIRRQKSQTLDLRKLHVSQNRSLQSPCCSSYIIEDDSEIFWSNLFLRLEAVKCLKRLKLGECPTSVIDWVHKGVLGKTIEYLSMELLGGKGPVDISPLKELKKLKELELIFTKLHILKNATEISEMKSITCLSVKTKSDYFDDPRGKHEPLYYHISKLPLLLLPKLVNLRKLTLEDTGLTWESDHVFMAVAALESLEDIELINVPVGADNARELQKCNNLKKLFIAPSCISTAANVHQEVIKSVEGLQDSLVSFKLGVYKQFLVDVEDKLKSQVDLAVTRIRYLRSEGDDEFSVPFFTICECEPSPCGNINHVCWMTIEILRKKVSTIFHKLETEVICIP